MTRFILLSALVLLGAALAENGLRLGRGQGHLDAHAEDAVLQLDYCEQCKLAVRTFQGWDASVRTSRLTSSAVLKSSLNSTLTPHSSCAGTLASKCNSAIGALTGMYMPVLSRLSGSCRTANKGVVSVRAPCPPVAICAAAPSGVVTFNICPIVDTEKLLPPM